MWGGLEEEMATGNGFGCEGHLESSDTDGFSPRSCQNSLEKGFKKQEKLREDVSGILGERIPLKQGNLRENVSRILEKNL